MSAAAASSITDEPRVDPIAALRGVAGQFLRRFMVRGGDHESRVRQCAALRPTDGEYDLTFIPGRAAGARYAYADFWAGRPVFGPTEKQTKLSVAVALSEELRFGSPRSRAFPAGYRLVAPLLRPGRLWVSWAYSEPGGGGAAFDGLMFTGERWAWFPQPWRYLTTTAPMVTSPMAIWAE